MNLFNGDACDPAIANTRAMRFGDGVFRTLLIHSGQPIDLDRQLDHLERDAGRLALNMPDRNVLRSDIGAQLEQSALRDAALRITLSRQAGDRGYGPQSNDCDRILSLDPLPAYASNCWLDGVCLAWSRVLLATQPLLAGIKHLNRLEQILASRDWGPDHEEKLMCDSSGRLVGGTRTNVFFVIDNIVVTPDLCEAGVAGMMRQKIMQLGAQRGREIEVGLIAPDEVRHASECFVSNSLIGIWPVRKVGSLDLDAPGPRTAELMNWLDHPWRGV